METLVGLASACCGHFDQLDERERLVSERSVMHSTFVVERQTICRLTSN